MLVARKVSSVVPSTLEVARMRMYLILWGMLSDVGFSMSAMVVL